MASGVEGHRVIAGFRQALTGALPGVAGLAPSVEQDDQGPVGATPRVSGYRQSCPGPVVHRLGCRGKSLAGTHLFLLFVTWSGASAPVPDPASSRVQISSTSSSLETAPSSVNHPSALPMLMPSRADATISAGICRPGDSPAGHVCRHRGHHPPDEVGACSAADLLGCVRADESLGDRAESVT